MVDDVVVVVGVVVEVEVVGEAAVVVVVVVVVGEELTLVLVLVGACCWLVLGEVSLADLWPKLAASLLLISETAPLSAPTDLTVTNLTRPRLVAVGVDLITRRKMRCCSPEAAMATAARATARQMIIFMADNQTVQLMFCFVCRLSNVVSLNQVKCFELHPLASH